MTDTKHTPGPWVVTTDTGEIADSQGIYVARAIYGGLTPEGKANSRLIAAAPDLLEALRELRKWMGPSGFDFEIDAAMRNADAAIAKATK